MIKKLTKIVWVVILSVTFSSISFAQESSTISRILENGELRVGTSGNQPPYTFVNKENKVVGYEMDLATALSESIGVKLTVVQMPFNELLGALEKGKIDVIMSGMTITPERNLKAAFVGPYMVSGKSIMTKTANLEKLDEESEINQSQVTLVALEGSTSESFVKNFLPEAKLITTKDYDSAVKMVMDDKASAMISDVEIIAVTMLRYPNSDLTALTTPLTIEPIGMALPPNDFLFVNMVENYFSALQLAGYLDVWQKVWFEDGTWLLQMK